jgi:hypothetical protein
MTTTTDFGTSGRFNETPVDEMEADTRAAHDYTVELRGIVRRRARAQATDGSEPKKPHGWSGAHDQIGSLEFQAPQDGGRRLADRRGRCGRVELIEREQVQLQFQPSGN